MKRKRYSNKLKAKVAIAAIKGDRTANEIASEFGIHVSQVNRWKKEALDQLPEIFDKKANARQAKDAEKEKDLLYRQIGKLQVEVDWLKKNTGHLL
jgi:transposase